ncbi:gamma-butyrobetaine hydroxylase-like domain-containing protein [Sneathiella glossodoripedis]|uniref:gamma-butyrobetaine hydroxylase-like domain-containing protein n=1 Tax=Sneathiella glossodoripedis TaxID=418853 RepID=UPI00047194D3|nr:DUF971 domain-containing protein [Sneathiella glossodoripedis]
MDFYEKAGRPQPTEVRLKKTDKKLRVTFSDGQQFEFPAELLRVESPSAEVQGHGASQKQLIAGRRHVGIMSLEPVGNYAVRLQFDDLHDTGLFSWNFLYNLGMTMDDVWENYLHNLEQAGLSRDP